MKFIKAPVLLIAFISLLAASAIAETCCEKAAAGGKECKNKCCIAAHKEGKSCSKCNPNKEDLKLKKAEKISTKSEKSAKSSKGP
jgi:hypothetical protein